MQERQPKPLWRVFPIMLMDRYSERTILIFLSNWRLSTEHTRESDLEPILRDRKLKQEISVWNNLLLISKQLELMRLLTPCDMGTSDLRPRGSNFPGGPFTGPEGADRINVPLESEAPWIRERLSLTGRLSKCQVAQLLFIQHLENLSKTCLHRGHLSVAVDSVPCHSREVAGLLGEVGFPRRTQSTRSDLWF